MSNKVKTYFLSPGWDFPIGSISLGAIISDPSSPHKALSASGAVPIDTPTHPSHKYDFSETIDNSKSHKYGLWAQFLQIFGLGAEASVSFERGSVDKYAFKHMKTEWFLPSEAFARACTQLPSVAGFLERTDYEKPVYIITGLKVVSGASVTTITTKGRSLRAKLGFDGTPAVVPVTVGPEAEYTKLKGETATFDRSSPVVFAYQLSEVRCKEGVESVTLKDHTAGAMFEARRESAHGDLKTEIVEGSKQLLDGREVVTAFDEDEQGVCNCVLPKGMSSGFWSS